jgi:hypothetical protein
MAENKRPPMPTNFTWYSVCSAHRDYNTECANCNAGHWVNDELTEFTHWLYERYPRIWRKWANRETTPDQPGHTARHFLESIFPGLRSKK